MLSLADHCNHDATFAKVDATHQTENIPALCIQEKKKDLPYSARVSARQAP